MRFNDGTTMRLYRQTIEDFSLYADKEFSQEEFGKLCEAAGVMSARMRAVRIVAATGVSERDLEQRLVSKGERPDQAKAAVKWLTELDLLDDRKTAEQIVQRCIGKGYGLSRAKQMLYEKQIPKELWEEVLSDYPEQTDAILSYLRGKIAECDDSRSLRKVIDSLIRKGHSYSQIRRALDALLVDTDDFPED